MTGDTNMVMGGITPHEILFYNAYFSSGTGTATNLFNTTETSLTKGPRYDEYFSEITSNKITAIKNCLLDITFMTQISSDTASYNNSGELYIHRETTNTDELIGSVNGNRVATRCLNISNVKMYIGDTLSGKMIKTNSTTTTYAVLGILKGG